MARYVDIECDLVALKHHQADGCGHSKTVEQSNFV